MFVMTMSKTMLRRVGAVAACAALLAAGAIGLKAMTGDEQAVETAAAAPSIHQKITGAQDLQPFLSGYGLQIDPAMAQVSQVKIPRKWDESFQAFHEVIRKSGLDLSKVKNRTVDKWVVPVPAQTNETTQTYAVVLVYKEQAKGAYLLQKPSGEVLPLTPPAAPTAASQVPNRAMNATQQANGQSVPVQPQIQPNAAQASQQNIVSEPANADAPVEVTPDTPALETGAMPTE